MENLVALPLLIPLTTAIALVPLRGAWQRAGSVAGGVATLLSAVALAWGATGGSIRVLRLGSWGPHVGVVWVSDPMSALFLVAAALVGLAAFACVDAGFRGGAAAHPVRPLMHLLAAGVNGALLTGDFFNLFVFYEVMLLASFALIVTGEEPGALARSLPYVLVNLVASALLLAAVGAVYALAGTVNMAELSARLASQPPSAPLRTALGMMLAVFGVKAGVVPVFVWLPNAYPAAPSTITALFAGLLSKVGVYTLFRAVPLLFPPAASLYPVLVAVGALTMVVGVGGALGRDTVRGILSFHVISQVGYMVFGLGLATADALAAAVLFAVHNMVVKPALILAGAVAERLGGTGALKALGGLSRSSPWAAAAFFLPALALAGVPPLSGFWAKLLLLRAGFASGASLATATALMVSFLTLASMLKIWTAVYWGAAPAQVPAPGVGERSLLGAALGLGALAVGIGLGIDPLLRFAEAGTRQVWTVRPYVAAVLRGAP